MIPKRPIGALLLVLASVAALAAQNRDVAPGMIIVVGGVGGMDFLGGAAQIAFPRAGVKHEIREFVWTHGWGHWLRDLQDSDHLMKKAAELARVVRQVKIEDPERPVFLVAKSGGTGLVLAAAALLPPQSLERIVLLSAAVSPQYDLCGALRATRQEIVSFHSPYDQFILNLGTRQFGTIDRVYGPSAGLYGFREPAHLDETGRALYRRLVQIPWQPRMLLEGHPGNHAGTSFPSFLAVEVAPWVR